MEPSFYIVEPRLEPRFYIAEPRFFNREPRFSIVLRVDFSHLSHLSRSRLTLGKSGRVKSGVTEVRKIHTENNGKSRLPSEKPGLRYVKPGLQPGLHYVKPGLHLGSKLGSVNVELSNLP